ncbi:MAG: hypothetical protein OSA51_00960 [Octadecabacter sp.]|nr:hypothetical protein [Octadecabacter sp.]
MQKYQDGRICDLFEPNWFRTPKLFDEISQLSDNRFFSKFLTVIFSATSMGAYAACAFSALVPGSTVIAFSPQATLAPGEDD